MNFREPFIIGRAIARVLADSERTEEIHRVEEITGRGRYRAFLAQMGDRSDVVQLLADRPELNSDQVNFANLRAMPPTTLGGAYVRHLDAYGLNADSQAVGTQYISDPDMSYLMRRFRQTHDVWHALLGVGAQGHEEVIIHAFSWGQLRLPVSAMVVLFGALKHIVLERRWAALRHALADAYRCGRDAEPLLGVYWEHLWEQPLDDVRQRYRITPLDPAHVHG